jgi:predicted enzyme related to lactoylglutathione lyase
VQKTSGTNIGSVCWIDLAAADLPSAADFYRKLFDWEAAPRHANGGSFTELQGREGSFGSIYQLSTERLRAGTPSHWIPYVCVADIEATAARAVTLGGELLVRPFDVGDVARIAVILDAVGAQIGLWQSIRQESFNG